jgi:hypothetical protein
MVMRWFSLRSRAVGEQNFYLKVSTFFPSGTVFLFDGGGYANYGTCLSTDGCYLEGRLIELRAG